MKAKINFKGILNFIKKHLVIFLTALGLFLILLAVVIIVFFVKENLNKYTIEEEEMYIYFDQAKFEFNTKITLDSSSGITKLEANGEEMDLESEPLYYKGIDKVIFPKEMAVVFPLSSGQQRKINEFTTLDASNGGMYLVNTNLNYPISNAFLFDGNNLYFFLEDTTVKVGEIEITVPAFSYAIYNFNKDFYLYHYEEDKMYYFANLDQDVLASTSSYTVNLTIDSIEYNGKSKLLLKNFSYLSNLKK